MSMSLMAKAMNIKVGNPIRKLVLLKLADNTNDKGECWPSYQHIADHCECSKSTVRDHIDALEKAGLLVKENRTGTNNGKGNASNVYYLKLDNPMPTTSTPPVPGNGTPMPVGGTPPVPTGGTRTSHSFEPVIEPVKNIPLPLADKKNKFDPLTEKPSNVSAEVWADWVEHRKEIRHPLTPTTCKRIRSMLENHVNPDAVIGLSIERGWQGLFPEKITEPANTTPAFDASRLTEEQRRELALYELLEGR
ncbi:helix-turn-helix domain-containing protein [Symbiopectobacterium purcellii]|uniref:helix-turn-helix domain-containing protein n=1 Tax=Symbiopectobacterium purcellii TaxID=2871826 RepID=UPI003F843841